MQECSGACVGTAQDVSAGSAERRIGSLCRAAGEGILHYHLAGYAIQMGVVFVRWTVDVFLAADHGSCRRSGLCRRP